MSRSAGELGRVARIGRNVHPPGLFVEDLGSTDGTSVDGERIRRQAIRLSHDVRVGSAPVPLSDPRIACLVVRVTGRPPEG